MNAGRHPSDAAIADEDLETSLVALAYLVLKHGEALAPLLDRVEREIEFRRSEGSPMAKAKKILEAAAARAAATTVEATPRRRVGSR